MSKKRRSVFKKTSYLLASLTVGATATFSTSYADESTYALNKSEKVLILFKDGVQKTEKEKVKKVGNVHHEYKNVNALALTVPASAILALAKNPHIKKIERDVQVKVNVETPDWGIEKTQAPKSWESGLSGAGVKVAVIDTGVSPHEDLLLAGGKSVVSYTTSYNDDNGHGTHVAGIIGAKDNEIGVVGIAPESSVYAVKALDSRGSGSLSDIIAGIDWSVTNDMDIVNMSLGTTTHSLTLQQAVDRAYQNGVLVVAAAGNDSGAVNYPAAYSSAIAVSATDSNDALATFSSRGTQVEVAAPGVSILSTYLGNGYKALSGTSMASPYAAGNLALLKEKYQTHSAPELREELQKHTVDLGSVGRDSHFGFGLIQAPVKETTTPQPQEETLAAPKNVQATDVTDHSFTASWDASFDASSYVVTLNGSVIGEVTEPSIQVTNLASNTQYRLAVKAKNATAVSAESVISVSTKLTAPGTPANFQAVNITSSSLTLQWNAASNADHYELKRDGVVIAKITSLSFSEKRLRAGSTYTYEVVAVNSAGQSASATLSATTHQRSGKTSVSSKSSAR